MKLKEFNSIKSSNKNLVAYFHADWCYPCKRISPIIDDVCKSSKSVKLVKINVESDIEIVEKYKIQAVPTFILFQKNKHTSFNSLEKLKDALRSL